jgi:hypothetical protein
MPEYRRRLPHFHPSDSHVFITWRLWGSLPAKPDLTRHPAPGHAFAAQDRVLDRHASGPTMASRSPHSRHRRRSHSDRRIREAILSAPCVGRNAESCAFVDFSRGPGCGADEMVERIDGQNREPDHGPYRAAVLAGRVVGSLPARIESTQPDRGLYRRKPGFRRFGVFRGALALVKCRLAGETACPTKPCQFDWSKCRNSRAALCAP